jgi:hypothetical protein
LSDLPQDVDDQTQLPIARIIIDWKSIYSYLNNSFCKGKFFDTFLFKLSHFFCILQ